jgi:hypothetical protein
MATRVSAPSGRVVGIPKAVAWSSAGPGRRPDDRGRPRAVPPGGLISAVAGGAWIANISRTHALYTEGDGYRIRLPRMDEHREPAGGWFLREGTALVGSRAMLDEGSPYR